MSDATDKARKRLDALRAEMPTHLESCGICSICLLVKDHAAALDYIDALEAAIGYMGFVGDNPGISPYDAKCRFEEAIK